MVLQLHKLGWYAHGIVGFDHERARATWLTPEGFVLEAIFAIGRVGDPSQIGRRIARQRVPATGSP